MSLLNLPNEIKLNIGEYLAVGDLSSLHQTNRQFFHLFTQVLHREARQDVNSLTAAQHAASKGQTSLLQLLVLLGVNIDSYESSINPTNTSDYPRYRPLYYAIVNAHAKTVSLLLENGADVNAGVGQNRLYTPIFYAIKSRRADIIRILLDHGANPNRCHVRINKPTLTFAVAHDVGLSIISTLLDGGADISARDYQGRTALHKCMIPCEYDIAKLLLDRGSDVNSVDNDGNTVICWASRCRRRLYTPEGTKMRLAMFRLLCDHGADVSIAVSGGTTVLFNVTQRKDPICVEEVLRMGVDLMETNTDGKTMLEVVHEWLNRSVLEKPEWKVIYKVLLCGLVGRRWDGQRRKIVLRQDMIWPIVGLENIPPATRPQSTDVCGFL